MRLSAVYGFTNAPSANRFLHDVNSNASLARAKAALYERDKVRITYLAESGVYDNTLSLLDDLSAQYGGKEIDA